MKVLIINKFLYPKGGDAVSAINTGKLLRANNHKVVFWGMDHPLNPKYPHKNNFASYMDFNNPGSILRRIKMSFNIMYSVEAKKKLEKVIEIEKPDVVHLHNFAHQISPSILHIMRKFNIPSVMTMHDYKLVCPIYRMYLDSNPCEKCKDGKYYQCFFNTCAKNSHLKSLLNALEMYLHHNVLNIYNLINVYISPSIFLKNKSEQMGFRKRIVHLPNFIRINEFTPNYYFDDQDRTIVYVGRLSHEKGLITLIDAVQDIKNVTLKVLGDGPLRNSLESKVKNGGVRTKINIQFLGIKSGDELKNEIRGSMFAVLPSEWYENNPFSIIECFALGKPVIGSRIGGIPELVRDNETGLCFEKGNSNELRHKIEHLVNNPEKIIEMGKNAREFAAREFNAEKHYEGLIEIYNQAHESRGTTG